MGWIENERLPVHSDPCERIAPVARDTGNRRKLPVARGVCRLCWCLSGKDTLSSLAGVPFAKVAVNLSELALKGVSITLDLGTDQGERIASGWRRLLCSSVAAFTFVRCPSSRGTPAPRTLEPLEGPW